MNRPAHDGTPETPSSAHRIDEVCDRFEAQWRAEGRASIEDFLGAFPEPQRAALFRELLELECELCGQAPEQLSQASYCQRFPDYAAIVRDVFARRRGELSDETTEAYRWKAPTFDELSGRLGPYEIVSKIGSGGMGVVLRAYEPALDRDVAVKLIRRDLAADRVAVERFRQEARLAAQLSHPHVVTVHTVGEEAGYVYLAMQYVQGESLADWLRRSRRLPCEEALQVLRQCLEALSAAHARGIVHRDIKPANILIERPSGRVLLSDFGLARLQSSRQRLTDQGEILGTASYIAPEQCTNMEVDGRADLYSLGVVMYQLLSGRLPFRGPGATQLLIQHINEPPPPLSQSVKEVPPWFSDLVMKLLAKDPEDRFQSAEDVLRRLAQVGESREPSAKKPRRRIVWRGLLAMAGLLLIGLIGLTIASSIGPSQETGADGTSVTPPTDDGADPTPEPPLSSEVEGDAFTNSIGMQLRRMPAGSFEMGGPETAAFVSAKFNLALHQVEDEYPRHEVRISRPFFIGVYEVTQDEYEQVMGENPASFEDERGRAGRLPVENVTWNEAEEFCRRLNEFPDEKRHGRRYRLPTEAEWEYACRLSCRDKYFAGGDEEQDLERLAWYGENAEGRTHPVGSKQASPSGLYDMHGNVAEWCRDAFGVDYYTEDSQVDPVGPTGLHRVIRGGSWSDAPGGCRMSHREHLQPILSLPTLGFRVVMQPSGQHSEQAP